MIVQPVVEPMDRFAALTQAPMVLSGYRVPPGVSVVYTAFLSTNSDSQFPEAAAYRPERWLRGHPCHHRAHAFSSIPFGHGARMCVGRRFAELELSVLAIRTLQRFRLHHAGPGPDLELAFTNRPDRPVNIAFIDR